ncbi:MAG: UbiA family prenyltransferase [Chloroflexota bacterium]|nr:UbiA family prenyltransferase [Anaerolineales bacterium]
MKRFFALSRTTHGVLDIAMPGFAALLLLGDFPHWQVLLLSLLTAFAAYTAIYALNDLMGLIDDREKFVGGINAGYSVEASELRYPLAQNAISLREGVLWFAGWFMLALIGSYLLNPAIVIILILAAVLEVIYCLLHKVTYWRTIVSGLVKSSGPIAALFVVNPDQALRVLPVVLAWVFCWEVGGQNIPADWNDTVEDKRVNAKTIPLQLGTQKAGMLVLFFLGLTVVLSLILPLISLLSLGWLYLITTAIAGFFLLLIPGYRLYQRQEGRLAAELFNRASYYPLAQLAIITLFVVFK